MANVKVRFLETGMETEVPTSEAITLLEEGVVEVWATGRVTMFQQDCWSIQEWGQELWDMNFLIEDDEENVLKEFGLSGWDKKNLESIAMTLDDYSWWKADMF